MKPTSERSMAPAAKMTSEEKIPLGLSKELGARAHDLSNSIECIMQACYLLNTSKLEDSCKKWAELIYQGARDAAQINRQIRDILRTKSEVQP
jgi:hypothetical protein